MAAPEELWSWGAWPPPPTGMAPQDNDHSHVICTSVPVQRSRPCHALAQHLLPRWLHGYSAMQQPALLECLWTPCFSDLYGYGPL